MLPICDYCNRKLFPGISRSTLTNGYTICGECHYFNEHLRDVEGVKFYWKWFLIFPRKYYYIDK